MEFNLSDIEEISVKQGVAWVERTGQAGKVLVADEWLPILEGRILKVCGPLPRPGESKPTIVITVPPNTRMTVNGHTS